MPENHIYHVTESVSDTEREAVIRTVMMMAPPYRIGNCKVCDVDARMLSMDMTYQRNPHQKSRKLRQEFDINKFDPIRLSYRDGLLFIIDGGHRVDAAIYNGVTAVPARIHEGMTQADEAKMFSEQMLNVVNLTPYDTFRANIYWGEPIDTAIKDVCDAYGLTVCESKAEKTPAHSMTAITTCRTIMSSKKVDGKACLDWMFAIMKNANWFEHKFALSNKVIYAFYKAYWQAILDNMLDKYATNLTETLSRVNVNNVNGLAAAKWPHHEARSAFAVAINAIGKGEVTFADFIHMTD